MAVTHIRFEQGSQHGVLLHTALSQLENGFFGLGEIKATMQTMISGDGSDPAHFTYMTGRFGFPDDATSKAAWDEINSLLFKLTTDSTIDHVNAALIQAWNKFR